MSAISAYKGSVTICGLSPQTANKILRGKLAGAVGLALEVLMAASLRSVDAST
ncbi:MAG: hypothetical protein ACKVOO_11595 [Burkholderiaceae bacterium]